MAALQARQKIAPVTTGTALKTIVQLLAPTNQRVKVNEIAISFNGVSNTDAPILVEGLVQTSAGTASAGTPVAVDGDMQETIQTATQLGFSSTEPTAAGVLFSLYVHPQSGVIVPLPGNRPIVLKGGTRFGVRVTAAVAVSATGYIDFEE